MLASMLASMTSQETEIMGISILQCVFREAVFRFVAPKIEHVVRSKVNFLNTVQSNR